MTEDSTIVCECPEVPWPVDADFRDYDDEETSWLMPPPCGEEDQ